MYHFQLVFPELMRFKVTDMTTPFESTYLMQYMKMCYFVR